TVESAYSASESLLLALNASKGGVQAVFAPNESSTFGMLLALEKAGLTGKLKFIGFDASEKLIEALRTDKLQGLIVQNPFQMGYLGVSVLVQHLRGKPIAPLVDTGSTFVQRSDLDNPATKQLLLPDLTPYLSGE
ncbi:MAG TPA: substrate-binding domain-containing protein, partial [Polyangiaceae bacterium]